MAYATDRTIHRLVVTGPERDRLDEHFRRLFYGRDDVTIVKDRRFRERRVRRVGHGGERRGAERRDGPPEWVVPPG
jgi:hypothetical protein